MDKKQKRAYVSIWRKRPRKERSPKTIRELSGLIEVSEQTIYSWIKKDKLVVAEVEEAGEERQFLDQLKYLANKENPNSKIVELYMKQAGFMEKVVENDYNITADDHFRIRRDAQERLREVLGRADGDRSMFSGVEGVPVFSNEIRVDIKQGDKSTEEGEVGTVGISQGCN